ncbi:MAG: dipicolinate synthase subunit B [Dethiobacteria bacterium]
MDLMGVKIGLALTGSHCTMDQIFPQIDQLRALGAEIFPIISPSVDCSDTRFGDAWEIKEKLALYTGEKIIKSIVEAEPIGPQKLFDVIVVAPCTGNTLAKLAHGITDTAVLMAIKAQLRNQRPVVLGIATNDGLGLNARNIGFLLAVKNIYMVPFGQDDPFTKPSSLVFDTALLIPTIKNALEGKQIQPLLLHWSPPEKTTCNEITSG